MKTIFIERLPSVDKWVMRRSQKGYFLLTMTLSLACTGAVIAAVSYGVSQYQERERARATGAALERLASVVDEYIVLYASDIVAGRVISEVDTRTGKKITVAKPLQPTARELLALSKAPGLIDEKPLHLLDAAYQIRLIAPPSGACKGTGSTQGYAACRIKGVVYIDKPILKDGRADLVRLSLAAREIGRHGGYSTDLVPRQFTFLDGPPSTAVVGFDNPTGLNGVLVRRIDAIYANLKLQHQRDGHGRAASYSADPQGVSLQPKAELLVNYNDMSYVRRERTHDGQNSFSGPLWLGNHDLHLHAFTQAGMGQWGVGNASGSYAVNVGKDYRSDGIVTHVSTLRGPLQIKTDVQVKEDAPLVTKRVDVGDTTYTPKLVFGRGYASFPSVYQEEIPGSPCSLAQPGITFFATPELGSAMLVCGPKADYFRQVQLEDGGWYEPAQDVDREGVWQVASMADSTISVITLPEEGWSEHGNLELRKVSLPGWRVCIATDSRVKTILKNEKTGHFDITYDRGSFNKAPRVTCYGGRGRSTIAKR